MMDQLIDTSSKKNQKRRWSTKIRNESTSERTSNEKYGVKWVSINTF